MLDGSANNIVDASIKQLKARVGVYPEPNAIHISASIGSLSVYESCTIPGVKTDLVMVDSEKMWTVVGD